MTYFARLFDVVCLGENLLTIRRNGILHCDTGPAFQTPTEIQYHSNGKAHRTDGGPAVICGVYRAWMENGQTHRVDGPAVVYADGHEEWWLHGVPQLLRQEEVS